MHLTTSFHSIVFLGLIFVQASAEGLTPQRPETFFINPNSASQLTWNIASDKADTKTLSYRIFDYTGKIVTTGEASRTANSISTSVKLPRGYYDIEIGGDRFGVISQEVYDRATDPFFGIDAVLNWLDRRQPMRESMVRSLKRSGVAIARERINWNQVEPRPSEFNWEESDQAWALRQIYQKESLPVLEMFHSAGPARGAFPVKSSYPQNLAALTQGWPVIYEKFKPTWGGIEVWNEPEGPYGSYLPADQYTTLVKAMRYTWQKHGIPSPLGAGVFIGGDPGAFHQFCALNGMLGMADFISLHDYKPATKMERLIALHRAWLKEYGKESLPLWLTESGWAWPKGGSRPPLECDQESALQIVMKGIEAKACGIARYMPFCLAFYEEGGTKSFSMMGKEVTPLRSMGAYTQSIRVLSGKKYIGDLSQADASLLRARVFVDEKSSSSTGEPLIVLYTDAMAPDKAVALPIKVSRIEGIDGRELALTRDWKIPVPDGLTYVWATGGTINASTQAMRLLRISQQSQPVAIQASPIVLQYVPNPAQVSYSSACYLLKADQVAHMDVTVRVHNLSTQKQTSTVTLQLPNEAARGQRAQTIEVPPLSVQEVNWKLDLRHIWSTPEPRAILVSAKSADNTPDSSLAIPLLVEGALETYLPLYSRSTALPIGETSRWVENRAPNSSLRMEAMEPAGWRMQVTFTTGDRWAYPKFPITSGTLSEADGFLLRARVQKSALVRMALYKKNGTAFLTAESLIPADNQWHVVYVPFQRFEPNQDVANKDNGFWEPADIEAIGIGLNDQSQDKSNVLEVSDLIVVARKK